MAITTLFVPIPGAPGFPCVARLVGGAVLALALLMAEGCSSLSLPPVTAEREPDVEETEEEQEDEEGEERTDGAGERSMPEPKSLPESLPRDPDDPSGLSLLPITEEVTFESEQEQEDLSLGKPVRAEPMGRPRPSLWGGRISGGYSTGDGLSLSQVDVAARFAVPLDPPRRMLMVSPTFGLTAVNADSPLDVPKELYNFGLNVMWMERLDDRWGLQMALSPSTRGDAESLDREIRLAGMAMLTWDWRPDELQLTFGAAYTGRDDIPILPMAGLQWTPNEDWQIGIGLPAPRIARRLWVDAEGLGAWAYVTGGLGGGTWDVRRADGRADELSIREYRAAIGAELGQGPQRKLFLETGLTFSRKLEYEKGGESISFGEGVFVQAGWNF